MKKFASFMCLLFVLIMVVSIIPVGAEKPYQTYTYSIDGKALLSPNAYDPQKNYTTSELASMFNGVTLNGARDMVTDSNGNIYIADTGNNRILILDRYFNLKMEIKDFLNNVQINDSFKAPAGIFVTEDRLEQGEVKYPGRIYVCDTDNARIVTFTLDGKFASIIKEPESELFDSDHVYRPIAIAVDNYDRLFVVGEQTNEGVIVMTNTGEFTGFIGAQQSVTSLWDQIWKRFQTKEQRQKAVAVVSYPYNNISINERGFIYATINAEELKNQMTSAITSKSKEGTYAPCKLLNPAGDEIMRRNGFWPPAGEVDFGNTYDQGYKGISVITDVACGPEQTWTIVDSLRCKIYTYDYDGNLLFAFGDKDLSVTNGRLGTLRSIQSVVYHDDALLVLDGDKDKQTITVYERTPYGDSLIRALEHQNNREYDKAIGDWEEILRSNSNYDAAYIGIGLCLSNEGRYEEAIEYYKAAYDTQNYSVAYKEMRKEWMSRFFIFIPIAILVLCVLIVKFMRHAAKINKKAAVSGTKRTFKEELYYTFHVMFHPFDGFWDLKHEKRGSMRASLVFVVITIIAMFYGSVGSGYITNPRGEYSTILMEILIVLVPVLLFVVANWCLTTLFDGEGSLRDIFIALGYALPPIAITMIPTTFASNFVVADETGILSLITTIGFIWAAFLIFFGMMVTHDYTIGKNIGITAFTIVGMGLIMFLAVLFTSLVVDMVSYVTGIISEVTYRM